jgi:hypothetical protein
VTRRGQPVANRLAFALFLVAAGCAPGAPPYAQCGDGVGCDGARCNEHLYTLDDGSESGGSFCSQRCTDDGDCADGGVCVTVDVDPPLRFVCVARCELPSDCYSGSRCTELVGPTDVSRVCLPGG